MQLTFVNPQGELTRYDSLYHFYGGPMLEDMTDRMYSLRLRFIRAAFPRNRQDKYPPNHTFYIIEADPSPTHRSVKNFLQKLLYETKDETPFVIFAPQLAPNYRGKVCDTRWEKKHNPYTPSIMLKEKSTLYSLAKPLAVPPPVTRHTLWTPTILRNSFHDPKNAKIYKRVGDCPLCAKIFPETKRTGNSYLWGFSLAALAKKLGIKKDAKPTTLPLCFVLTAYPKNYIEQPLEVRLSENSLFWYIEAVLDQLIKSRKKLKAIQAASIEQKDTSLFWDEVFRRKTLCRLQALRKEKEASLTQIRRSQLTLNIALEKYAYTLDQLTSLEENSSPIIAPEVEKQGLINICKNCFLSVSLSEDGTALTCQTKPLRMAPRHDYFVVEPLEICICLNTGNIRFTSLIREDEFHKVQHPHVFSDGSACFGNLSSTLGRLFVERKLLEGLTLLVRFLRTYTPGDPVHQLGNLETFPIEEFGDITDAV